jgi:hypothetical protein
LRNAPGLQIFHVHPIHVYLNTVSLASYAAVKRQLGPLHQATADRLNAHVNDGAGIGQLFDEVLDLVASASQGALMRDLL